MSRARSGRKRGGKNPNGGWKKKLVSGQQQLNFGQPNSVNVNMPHSNEHAESPTNNATGSEVIGPSDTQASLLELVIDEEPTLDDEEEGTEKPDSDRIIADFIIAENEEDSNLQEPDDESDSEENESVLQNYFISLQVRFNREKNVSEYDRKTIWVEPPNPYFTLRQSPDPKPLYYPRVFLWFPHSVIKGMQDWVCPNCSESLKLDGYTRKPHARRIVDLDR